MTSAIFEMLNVAIFGSLCMTRMSTTIPRVPIGTLLVAMFRPIESFVIVTYLICCNQNEAKYDVCNDHAGHVPYKICDKFDVENFTMAVQVELDI